MLLTPCCLKSKIWKTGQAQAPRGSDHYRECAQRPGYLPWLCNHRSDQSRDSTTAEGMSTARLLRRRRPEARRWIKDDSCAKLVSMELLFQTKSYSFVCVSLFDFIRPRLSPSLLHPSYHLRFLLIHSYFTFFRLEDFSDHFPILTTNKLNGKTSGPHWELDWPFALCSGMSMLRIQQYSSPAGLMDAWKSILMHTCWSWHWKTQFMLSPDKKPQHMFFFIRCTCRKLKMSFLVSYAKQKQPPGTTITADWKLKSY